MTTLTRRNLLKLAGTGACAAALSLRSRAAETPSTAGDAPKQAKANGTVYRFQVGGFEAISIASGFWKIPAPQQPRFAPQASADEFKTSLENEGVSVDSFALHFNILLLRTGKETILFDAGFAGKQAPHFDLAGNLALAGLNVSDIDTVFLSHAHSDHMGGMLDDSGRPVFSNAQHLCSAIEQDFWMSKNPDFSTSRSDEKARAAGIAAARRTFESIKFTGIRGNTRLPEGISAIHSPGHTPGHMTLRIHSKGESLYHIVDLAHHFAIMIPHPDWTVSFDVNETLAAKTRREIFTRLAAEKTPVLGYHLPSPGLGQLRVHGSGFRWIPRPWEPGV